MSPVRRLHPARGTSQVLVKGCLQAGSGLCYELSMHWTRWVGSCWYGGTVTGTYLFTGRCSRLQARISADVQCYNTQSSSNNNIAAQFSLRDKPGNVFAARNTCIFHTNDRTAIVVSFGLFAAENHTSRPDSFVILVLHPT